MPQGRKVGVLKVRLYRPFSIDALVAALPPSVRSIAVLDRCKEPGAIGEPLYLDVVGGAGGSPCRRPASRPPPNRGSSAAVTACRRRNSPRPWSRRCSTNRRKDKPKRHFTVGINDDVTGLSLAVDTSFKLSMPDEKRAVFYGLGADGTVGANKNSIKIVADHTDLYAQGYFVYDSKKSNGSDRLASALQPASDQGALSGPARPTSWPATTSSSWKSTTCSSYAANRGRPS